MSLQFWDEIPHFCSDSVIWQVANLDSSHRFYYGDQRHPDGEPLPTGLSGPAHAETYFKLAENLEQGPWQQTFVEGIGYREFPKKEIWNNKL